MANDNHVASRTPQAFGNYVLGAVRGVNIAAAANAVVTIPLLEGGLTPSGNTVTSGTAALRRITIGNYSSGNIAALNVSIGWTNDGANLVVNAATVASVTANNMFQDLTLNATANNTFINGNVSSTLFVNVVAGQVANGTVDIKVFGDLFPPMSMATVTNTSTDVFEDGWDGERYVFAPGKKVAIPYVAAVHIFGHGLKDKESVLARLGWIVTHNDLPDGLKRLAKFKIEDDGKHHSLSPVVQRVPLNSPKGEGGKLSVSPDAGRAVPLNP